VTAHPAGTAPARLRPSGAVPCPEPAGITAYPWPVSLWTDPEKVPADRSVVPDTDVITIDVWARLQGVSKVTAQSNLSKSNKRREAGEPRPGDMPEPDDRVGQTPVYLMGTYRAWEAARPGRSGGTTGTGSRGGQGAGKRVRLPLECPHCHHQVTEADLEALASLRAKFTEARETGATVADAAKAAGISPETARSWEFARRGAGRRGPLTAVGERHAIS
jgi:hypothetical protein